jgi:hypothetical protein
MISKPKQDDPEQSKLFMEAARELGADREAPADYVMGRLAKTPPKPHALEKPKAKASRKKQK